MSESKKRSLTSNPLQAIRLVYRRISAACRLIRAVYQRISEFYRRIAKSAIREKANVQTKARKLTNNDRDSAKTSETAPMKDKSKPANPLTTSVQIQPEYLQQTKRIPASRRTPNPCTYS